MNLPLGGQLFFDQEALRSLGALRLLRSSRFALTQPDAFGAGESLGGLEFGRTGEVCLGLGGGKFRCVGFIIPLDGARAFRGWGA